MQFMVTSKPRLAVRRELVKQLSQGVSVREARASTAILLHRTTVYRLLKRVQREGEYAFVERRHGHPMKPRHLYQRGASLFVSRRELSLLRLPSQVLADKLHQE